MNTDGVLSDDEITQLLKGLNSETEETEREKSEDGDDIEELKKEAEAGDVNAQGSLALRYSKGKGIAQSYEQAAFWYEKAALQGDAGSQCLLAICYTNGEGVEKDAEKAFYWFEKAALQGDSGSQCLLAICYDFGDGVEKDVKKAAFWHEKAAQQGDDYSQCFLGMYYEAGKDVPKDYEKAAYWFEKAAERGNSNAQMYLGMFYENGLGAVKDQKQADYWYAKAACDHTALELLVELYNEGKINNSKNKTAGEWYQSYACDGNAARNYANSVREADEEDVDLYIKSVYWHEQAAKKGAVTSFYQLAQYYSHNNSNMENVREAFAGREIVPSAESIAGFVNKFYPVPEKYKTTEPDNEECAALKNRIASLAETVKMMSIFALGSEIEKETNPVFKTGLKMILDGIDLDIIKVVMETLLAQVRGEGRRIILNGIIHILKGEQSERF